jgi:hypothetical protein
MMRAPADRRTNVRFEVFGAFWGTFDAGGAVRVRDLTPYGALIEARQALAVESVQPVFLILDGQPAVAQARVRYVRPATSPDCFLVGLEFISTSMLFAEAVERLLNLTPSPSELS